jgi:ribonuclease P protein component
MSQRPAERIPGEHRLRTQADFTRLKTRGHAVRGAHCLVVVEACPAEPTKVGFVASKKGVGDAVRRNRARRRLREIVRRHWPEIATEGVHMMFVAFRSALVAPHAELAADVERLLVMAGALRPMENR